MSKIFVKLNIYILVKLLFYLFPFFMLLESAFVTTYVTLFIITTLFLFYSKKIRIKFDCIDYLLLFFFLLGFVASLLNITILGKLLFFKSISDFRFLIFFFLIRNLINHKIVNLKFIFIVALSCTFFLSLDIIYQHINNKDFFGNPPFDGRFNGTFEHEAIAGSYIQKNFILSLSAILLLTIKYQKKFFFLLLVSTMLGVGILLSLDRMPFIIYLFIIILLIFFLKEHRILFIFNFMISSIIFIFLFSNYKILNDRYTSLHNEFNYNKFVNFFSIPNNEIIKKNIIEVKNDKYLIGDYSKIYKTSYYVWLKNPIIGSGKRSFGKMCDSVKIFKSDVVCSTHPHNIYLEIIVTHGVLGLITFLTFLAATFYSIKKKIFTKNHNNYIINSLFLIILFSELFPLRSYGSIFQTVNGTMFWFILALINSKK